MKPLFAALLAGLLCTQTVSSLFCFVCDKVDDNNKCYRTKQCGDTDRYCITKYFGGGSGERHRQLISKDCSAHCPSMELDIGLMAFSVNCCEDSFCNTSGAVSVKTSSLLLLVGSLASIFYIMGANL
ncbi:lymphocyte antigen 6E-like [Thamnophis elegans]|uniref:lymphocyte antigen 6E-like n=1 Tax=Thamnophis elegans TaxID=35005 RepID=UPI001376EC99|nr:lymphocyte antigen 6E-like [Thamnophis elegans]